MELSISAEIGEKIRRETAKIGVSEVLSRTSERAELTSWENVK